MSKGKPKDEGMFIDCEVVHDSIGITHFSCYWPQTNLSVSFVEPSFKRVYVFPVYS